MSTARDAWTREFGAHDRTVGNKTYRNLVLFTRPCATCGAKFGIYVTQAVAEGHKSNNNFGLKNCEVHRSGTADREELSALRFYKQTTAAELTELYARNKALFEELQVCKAKLAQFDLPAMMEAGAEHAAEVLGASEVGMFTPVDISFVRDAIGCEPVQNTMGSGVAFPWNKT